MVINLIDEACKCHVACVVRRGFCHYNELGNCDAQDLLSALSEWTRYLPCPRTIHIDEEGVFNSDEFKEWCQNRPITLTNCAGEAHWQDGIVERHIQTLKRMIKKTVLDDHYSELDFEDIVDLACQAKNDNGRYGGYSPMQWFHGRGHPLMDGAEVLPSLEAGSPY